MVSYLKNNTDYGYYLMESDGTNNDDWITDHSGDPGEADLDTYTLGSEYIYIGDITMREDYEEYGWESFQFADGEGFDYTIGMERGVYRINGYVTTDAYMEDVKDFCKRHNRDSAKQIYLVHRRGSTDYEKFYDEDHTELKYARGHVLNRRILWHDVDNQLYLTTIAFRILWT